MEHLMCSIFFAGETTTTQDSKNQLKKYHFRADCSFLRDVIHDKRQDCQPTNKRSTNTTKVSAIKKAL